MRRSETGTAADRVVLGSPKPRGLQRNRPGDWSEFLARARRNILHLIGLWLSIAMVLGHALAPVGSPVARTKGSAFSASTSDVSLGPSRAGLTAKIKRAQDGTGDGAAGSDERPAPFPAPAGPPAPAARHDDAPVFRIASAAAPSGAAPRPFDARAPPRA